MSSFDYDDEDDDDEVVDDKPIYWLITSKSSYATNTMIIKHTKLTKKETQKNILIYFATSIFNY